MPEPVLEKARTAMLVAPDEWDQDYCERLIGLQAELRSAIDCCPGGCLHQADLVAAHRSVGERLPGVHRKLVGPPGESAA